MRQTADSVLHDVFGYSEFRPGQRDIIDTLMRGTHVLAVMPTGGGKSLCYQIPAILSEGLTIVVSPLVALMDDQVAALHANGTDAVRIHSGMDRDSQLEAWDHVRSGRCKIIYLSPERLMSERVLAALSDFEIAYFIIDEAHCISKWGVSFRPEYEMLSQLKERFPQAVFGAFTATADRATREDIAEKLFPGKSITSVHGFDRPNLKLMVGAKDNWRRQLMDFLEDKEGQSGIVYCLSRKYTEDVAAYLVEQGLNAIAYHAGQDPDLRKINQDRFMSEDAVIMVATIAFGMGIDKPDIRFVCHLNLPATVEAYYQEIGRAGRDGAPAETLMLFGLDDIRMRRMFIDQDGEDDAHKVREHKRLDSLLAYCEASQCRRQTLLAYFDEDTEPCGNCDNCLNPPVLVDGTRHAQMILSAVYRTGQVFGAAHVIDVVRGASTQKIVERGHDQLPTFGVGADQSKPYWLAFVRQLVAGGILSINIQKYGCLEITPHGRELLRGNADFQFREIRMVTSKKSRQSTRTERPSHELSNADDQLLTRLKTLRLELARARNVPAYVVFPDTTLTEIAATRPRTLEQLSEVNGVGPKKLKDYGETFLTAVSEAEGTTPV